MLNIKHNARNLFTRLKATGSEHHDKAQAFVNIRAVFFVVVEPIELNLTVSKSLHIYRIVRRGLK